MTIPRRDFLGTVAATGTGLLMGAAAEAMAQAAPTPKSVELALIGFGLQGRNLADSAAQSPGVHIRALCDIWPYRLQYGANRLKDYGQKVNAYVDYREMLDKEKGLDAVVIATPDFVHAEQANACLAAGLHVYCETMMADSIAAARSMIRAARKASRLLQIGYQRRSHPGYRHVVEKLLSGGELLERIVQVQTRWALGVSEPKGWPRPQALPEALLKKHGYAQMQQFRNWTSYSKYGVGLAAGLMAHQIDVVNWFLNGVPDSMLAAGGVDFYKGQETFDNLSLICQYQTPTGTVRACGQSLTYSRLDGIGHFEQFCGTAGTIRVSENPAWMAVYRDPSADDWGEWVQKNLLIKTRHEPVRPPTSGDQVVYETGQVELYALPPLLTQLPLRLHLENFFAAIRGTAELNCPAETAFRTEVLVSKAVEVVKARRALNLTAEDFAV
ncbi:MAG: Gfo/Idh/MocA family oxidoreductase [Thermoguttaceae bacterium]